MLNIIIGAIVFTHAIAMKERWRRTETIDFLEYRFFCGANSGKLISCFLSPTPRHIVVHLSRVILVPVSRNRDEEEFGKTKRFCITYRPPMKNHWISATQQEISSGAAVQGKSHVDWFHTYSTSSFVHSCVLPLVISWNPKKECTSRFGTKRIIAETSQFPFPLLFLINEWHSWDGFIHHRKLI